MSASLVPPERHPKPVAGDGEEPSAALQYGAGYCEVVGGLMLGFTALALVGAAFGYAPARAIFVQHPFAPVVPVVLGLSQLWTGRALRRKDRFAALGALVACVSPLLGALSGGTVRAGAFVFAVIGALFVWKVWRELE